jgi:DNA-binding PadR family transcriptional regulator
MPMKRFTSLKMFILGVMNQIPKPMSGYELINYANEWYYDHYIKATNASFYYALKQLAREEFIKESGTKQEGNRPEKTIFRLTNKGRKEFQEHMKYFLTETQEIYYDIDSTMPFMTLFGSILGKKFILDSICKQIERIRTKLEHIDEGEKIVTSHFSFEFSPFNILPLKHWKIHAEAEIKWLESFKEIVETIDDFKEIYQKYIKKSLDVSEK